MFENIMNFFKKMMKKDEKASNSKNTAKERLHLVLVQDRANVSADFLELMKQEIIEVIKKYIEVDEKLIDVHLTNHSNEDGTNGAPALYANIPIKNIKETARKIDKPEKEKNNENVESIIEDVEKPETDTEKEQITAENNNMEDNKNTDNKIVQEQDGQKEENSENVDNHEKEQENVKTETDKEADKEDTIKEEQKETENKTEE